MFTLEKQSQVKRWEQNRLVRKALKRDGIGKPLTPAQKQLLALVGHPKGNKYHALSKAYNGIHYHSALEAGYAAELDLRVKAHEIVRWDRQVPIVLLVNKMVVCRYFIDFIVYYPDNSREFVEVKGMELPEWKLKFALFEALSSKKCQGAFNEETGAFAYVGTADESCVCVGNRDRLRVVK